MLHMLKRILAVITLKISGYKMKNLFPTGNIIPVGHYITKLPGITGNFRRQLWSYTTSGCLSQGDHSLPGSHFSILAWAALVADGYCWVSRAHMILPQITNATAIKTPEIFVPGISNSHFCFPQSTFSISLSLKCPLHCHCQEQPGLLWLSTAEPRLTGCTGMSLKWFNCIKCLTPLTRMVKRLQKKQSLQKERKHKRRLRPSNNFKHRSNPGQLETSGAHVVSTKASILLCLRHRHFHTLPVMQ